MLLNIVKRSYHKYKYDNKKYYKKRYFFLKKHENWNEIL